jgi:uncharacterized membrane-anchored protein
LLEEYSREAAFILLVVAVLLFALSTLAGETVHLPSIALGWRLGLEIVRAAFAFAIVAAVVMVVVRGFGGMWPSGFSTTGLSYEQADAVRELAADLVELERLKTAVQAHKPGAPNDGSSQPTSR